MPIVSRPGIESTYALIRPYVRRTPVIEAEGRDFGLDIARIVFKLEHLQHAGSFKARGAFANMLRHSIPAAGVAAASGGNHGAAVAYAAQTLGVPARIFVPEVASPAKIDRIRRFGATLEVGGARYDDARMACEAYIAGSGALGVHAYDHEDTLLGQGSVALELAEQAPGITTVLVAVGGGGLIGGMAAYCAGETRVVAVEPDGAPTLHMARAAGEPVDAPAGSIAADSLAPRQVGRLMFPIAQQFVQESLLVSDEAISEAQVALWRTLRQVVEPGGAAAFAALLSGAYRAGAEERVAVVLCGANTDAVRL